MTYTRGPGTSRRCGCPGKWSDRLDRWVVIDRSRVSILKCLDCGWKWRSKCKYVVKLRDWQEESRSGMTDQDILDRLNEGSLSIVCWATGEPDFVLSCPRLNGKWKQLRIVERTDQSRTSGTTYKFVEITRDGKKKKIALHRLVWMFHHRRVIPDGYDIDHIQGKSNNIANLRLRDSSENRADNQYSLAAQGELPF